MILFLIGCIFWRNNLGYHQQEKKHEVHLSSTIRYLHLFGPTVKLHLNPTPRYLSIGMESSTALFFSNVLPIESIGNKTLKEIFFLSAIGFDIAGLNFSKEKTSLSVMNPYVQLHTPAYCPIERRKTMLCFTGFAEAQYNFIIGEQNTVRWNSGLSIHFGKGLFPY